MMKTAILAILEVLVSLGKKTSDTGIVGIAAIPKTIPKTIPTSIRPFLIKMVSQVSQTF